MLINAPVRRRAFIEPRPSGRHFDQNPWRFVPVPGFNRDDPSRCLVANLTRKYERAASRFVEAAGNGAGQLATSIRIHAALATCGLSDRFDAVAAGILPNHVDS